MVIVMQPEATSEQIQRVIERIQAANLKVHLSHGEYRTIIGVIGEKKDIMNLPIEAFDGVEKAVPITVSYKLVSREFHPQPTIVDVGGVKVGNGHFVVMAGPCAVESREQLLETAQIVKEGGRSSCGAAPSNPAPPLIPSRDWRNRVWPIWRRLGRLPA